MILRVPCIQELVCLSLVASFAAAAQGQAPNNAAVRAYVKAHQPAIMQEYLTYVATPDLHGNLPQLEKNADLLVTMLDKRGLHAQLWKTAGAPIVFGEKLVPGAKRTILF